MHVKTSLSQPILSKIVVAFDAGGENLFGVDASLSASYAPNCSLHGYSHCFFLATFATRHNSAFLNLIKKSNASTILGC
jgi:hypothetical protein